VRTAVALAGLTALALAPAPSAEGAGADPRVALSVSPGRIALGVPGSRTIRVRNDGAERVVVDVTRRPAGGPDAANAWLRIVPARVALRPRENAILTVRATRARSMEPGDHGALALLTTRPLDGGRVNVQVRLGVRITAHVAGRVVRRVSLGALRIHRRHNARYLIVPLANGGNVTLHLRGNVTASLLRDGKRLARLRPRVQRLLPPGTRAILNLPYRGQARGLVTAVVRVRLGPGIRIAERRYHLRL
jgi:hypothetical protein